jgi:thiol-disulfide isomerase/thioredoxin
METGTRSKLIFTVVMLLASNVAAQTKFRTPDRIPDQIMKAELPAVDGSAPQQLSTQAPIIVLGMWAAWCGPCRFQMPELERLHAKYRSRGLKVVGLVSLDGDANAAEVRHYLDQMSVTFKSLWVTRNVSEGLDPDHLLPVTFVIRNDGSVIRTFLGWDHKKTPRLLRKAVKEGLNTLKSAEVRRS